MIEIRFAMRQCGWEYDTECLIRTLVSMLREYTGEYLWTVPSMRILAEANILTLGFCHPSTTSDHTSLRAKVDPEA
jgi:hypothetical protein